MSHSDLVKAAYSWCCKNAACGVVFKELYNAYGEIPDVIGFGGWHSTLIECKASRSDFLADRKKPFRVEGKGMGSYRYYCCPAGLIKLEEIPPKWGLIYVSEKGRATCVFNPAKEHKLSGGNWVDPCRFERNLEDEQRFLYCALRRIAVRGGLSLAYSEKQLAKENGSEATKIL